MKINLRFLSLYKRQIAIIYDIGIVPLAWFGAYWLRFNLDNIPREVLDSSIPVFLRVLFVQMLAYGYVGLYRGIWRFSSIPDLVRIVRAVFLGVFFSGMWIYYSTAFQDFPRAVLPLYAMLLAIFLGGARFSVRWFKEYHFERVDAKRVLIIGAGSAGEGIVRDLLRDGQKSYKPIAFIDDNEAQQGREIHGVRVLGKTVDILRIAKKYTIDLIIIAIPTASAQAMRAIMEACSQTSCAIRTLPGFKDIVAGRVSIDLLREVSLEDLLGRDPVHLDWNAIRLAIVDKVVLVSGAGGSIGAELCRQIAHLKPKSLVLIERSEYNLFMLEQELLEHFPALVFEKHLIDINDRVALDLIMRYQCPDIIFHAAAYKHVPMLEDQPREAVANNILGTRCLAQMAVLYKVGHFVLVSTDKAVNPTNVMGATKRVSEMIAKVFNDPQGTRCIIVRFGNVLGSAGSVVPIFRQQLERGGPLTVTHPDITRFFMTIPEACQLILQALALGQGGEIFVLDMGEPVKIRFLAEQIIRLAGKKLEDIPIQYIGLRPGEKLYEELFYTDENLVATPHKKIFQAQIESHLNKEAFLLTLDQLEKAIADPKTHQILALLKSLVPSFGAPL
jgi:FlaA1/EpsC-like NDP-sugar epimerase